MSAREVPGPDGGFGLKRAIDRFKAPASKIMNMASARAGETHPGDGAEGRQRTEPEFRHRQMSLKTQASLPEEQELWPLPGLAPMTRVRTSFGDVHAIALRKGDEVLTRSGSYLPIVWITRIKLDEHVLRVKPDSNPIVLAPGSLGRNAPSAEMMVSPRQIICADDRSGLTSAREAATLMARPGIRRLQETGLSYTMLHVGEPADIYCEGLFLRFPLEA